MRGFIRFCAGIFVVGGCLIVILSVLAGVLVFAGGASELGRESPLPIGGVALGVLIMAVGSFVGASVTLVGGATALLGNIDQRLERFERRAAPELYGGPPPRS